MGEKKTVYRLYALQPTWESIKIAMNERYSRATPTPAPGYVLIYTAEEQPENSVEITEESRSRLTEADNRWLLECGLKILAEEAQKHEQELSISLSERVAALEKELKRRKQELTEKGD